MASSSFNRFDTLSGNVLVSSARASSASSASGTANRLVAPPLSSSSSAADSACFRFCASLAALTRSAPEPVTATQVAEHFPFAEFCCHPFL